MQLKISYYTINLYSYITIMIYLTYMKSPKECNSLNKQRGVFIEYYAAMDTSNIALWVLRNIIMFETVLWPHHMESL